MCISYALLPSKVKQVLLVVNSMKLHLTAFKISNNNEKETCKMCWPFPLISCNVNGSLSQRLVVAPGIIHNTMIF